MADETPSKDWTPEEKLLVIAELSAHVANNHTMDIRVWIDINERINTIALHDGPFLEHNRDRIFKGIRK